MDGSGITCGGTSALAASGRCGKRGLHATLTVEFPTLTRRRARGSHLRAIAVVLGRGWLALPADGAVARFISKRTHIDYLPALGNAARGEQRLLAAIPGVRVLIGAAAQTHLWA